MTKKDIAIIGGTFDPIHNGHIDMIKYLIDNYIVDEVWVLPSYNSPHKEIDTIKSFEHRLNMIKLAIRDIKCVSINTFEKEYYETHSGNVKTYTYEILEELKKKFYNCRFHFVVGFDSIKQINTWYRYEDLIRDYWFYIFDRFDNEFTSKGQKKLYLDNLGKNKGINFIYEFFDVKVTNISSTEIRDLFRDLEKNKDTLLTYLDRKVFDYILENNLYMPKSI